MSESQAPLTAAMFNVLLSLADGEKHGYAILKEVEEQTAGEVQLSTGTLYGIIKRLLTDGLIIESRNRPSADEDDQRRLERVSGRGHADRRPSPSVGPRGKPLSLPQRRARTALLLGCV